MTRHLRLVLLIAGLMFFVGGSNLGLTAHANSHASVDAPAWFAIRNLRAAGRCGEALERARGLVRDLSRDPRVPAWKLGDAIRLVATLQRISPLGDSSRIALGRADRADEEVAAMTTQGLYRRAAALADSQLEIRRRYLGEESPEVARSLEALGEIDTYQGDFHNALARQSRALMLRERVLGEDHPEVARSLELVGKARQFLNQLPEAEACDQRALDLRRGLFGGQSAEVAASLNRLADLRRRQGRLDEALALFRKALRLRQESLGPDDPGVAEILCNLGLTLFSEGKWREATPYLARAVELGHATARVSVEVHALSLSLYGLSLYKEGRLAEAERAQQECAWLFEALHSQGKRICQQGHSLIAYAQLAATQVRMGKGNQAWASLERSLGRKVLDGVDPPSPLTVPAAFDPRKEWPDSRFLSLESVQESIPEHTALIGWLDNRLGGAGDLNYPSWGYVIRRSGPVHWVRIDAPPAGSARVGDDTCWDLGLSRALQVRASWPVRSAADSSVNEMARTVYRTRVTPLEPYLDGVDEVVVIKAFTMTSFPFEILEDRDGRYLGEKYIVSYTPSATLYASLKERTHRRRDPLHWKVLAVGDPSWTPPSACDQGAAILPGSREEIRDIAGIFPASSVLLGTNASERQLTRLARSGRLAEYDLIHLATHAVVDYCYPENSVMLLAESAGRAPGDPAGPGPANDGRITPAEISATWKLRADLVTLSACASGASNPSPDPLGGLGEAVLCAGARSLLISLWKVDDAATSLLMGRFYQNLTGKYRDSRMGRRAQPMSKALALHEATNWLREYRNPDGRQLFANCVYWSAFSLVGDGGDPASR